MYNHQLLQQQLNAPAAEKTLLAQLLDEGKMAREEHQIPRALDMLSTLIDKIMEGEIIISNDIEASVKAAIAQIDKLLSNQVNEVIHHPDFQRLEASWRGLHKIVFETETSPMLKLRVLNCSKDALLRDFNNAVEFDQSALFKKVYEEEFGTFGGTPYSSLIGDYQFTNHPQDIKLLRYIAQVAAAAHAPFISSAGARFFGVDTFQEVMDKRDLATLLDQPEYIAWRSLRDSEDSRFLALCLPHIQMRLPYGAETDPVVSFNFEEDCNGTDNSKYLWGNPAYALGICMTKAMSRHNWCVAIRGVEGGGLVEDFPLHVFKTDQGETAVKIPTQVAIPDRREKEFSDLGFIPIVYCKNSDYAAFFGLQTVNKPKVYDTDAANGSAKLSAQLQYMFAAGRIAHYLKSIVRDKIGSFMSRQNCEDYLNRWIKNYVLLDDNATQEQKAKKPLREAQILVTEDKSNPGYYKAVGLLRPHFQLEGLNISLRLVTDLPPSAQQKS